MDISAGYASHGARSYGSRLDAWGPNRRGAGDLPSEPIVTAPDRRRRLLVIPGGKS
jgi:hypothetical protein